MNLFKCKGICKELSDCSHNTKNRVIETMCDYNGKECKILGNYLQSLMIIESLCNYICLCCCEHESLSSSILSELKSKCSLLIKQSDQLCKFLESKDSEYLRCKKIKQHCNKCKNMNSSKTKK